MKSDCHNAKVWKDGTDYICFECGERCLPKPVELINKWGRMRAKITEKWKKTHLGERKFVKLIKLKARNPMPAIALWFMETKRKVFGYVDSKVDFAINTGVKTFFINIGLPLFIISIVAVVIFFVFIN